MSHVSLIMLYVLVNDFLCFLEKQLTSKGVIHYRIRNGTNFNVLNNKIVSARCFNPIMGKDFPIVINWTSPFSFLGVLGVFFHFYFIFQ